MQWPLFPLLHATDDETDRPTLIDCVRFQGWEKRINIPQEIGLKYYYFGLLLLEDATGGRIRSIAYKTREDVEHINIEILKEWISGNGRPVTWRTLIEVLYDIELSTLAGEIEAVKNVETGKH